MHPSTYARLRPHQRQPVQHLIEVLEVCPGAVDFSDTGTGKTYVATAVARELDLPTLIVCPKIGCTAWKNAAEHLGTAFSIIGWEKLRTGRTPYGWWDNTPPAGAARETFWVCQSCQLPVDFDNFVPCYTHARGIHCLVQKKKAHKYGRFHFHPSVKLVVFDEVHRANGLDSLNGEMVISARRQGIRALGLSATAACSPLHLRALGYLMGLHTLVGEAGFYPWASRYGCRRDITIGPGWHWLVGEQKQLAVMEDIRGKMVPSRGVRVRTTDIPGFPERDITAELYDIDEANTANELYSEMVEALAVLDERISRDVAPESPLTKILRAHQKVELLKVPVATELAKDSLEKGHFVGLFCNYRATIEELAKRFPDFGIIDGTVTGAARDKVIADAQNNRIRGVIVNSRAGGICVSLQDLIGGCNRDGYVFPCFDIVIMRQLMGRFHRDGGKSPCHYRVMFAAGTVEVDMFKAWRAKGNNLDALNNGDLTPKCMKLERAV